MALRRIFYRWLFPAAVILPAWVLVGWAIFSRSGWSFVNLVFTLPMILLALAAIAGITRARVAVRADSTIGWSDVAVLGAWQACIVGFGFFGITSAVFALLGVAGAVIAFWWSVKHLMAEAKGRVAQSYAAYERVARGESPRPPVDGGVFVVQEKPTQS